MKKKCLFLVTLFLFLFMNKVAAVTYINRIDINYDTSKVKVSPAYTYNQVKSNFKKAWEMDSEVNYSKGNYNIWMYYCPTSERCTDEWAGGYDIKVLTNRYTWVNFEIYAKPFGLDKENPDYDFDKDHLDEIEVYVNGVKRDDVLVQGYNSSWREVDVIIPVEVDDSPFINEIRVNSEYSNVSPGSIVGFESEAEFYGDGYDEVTWSVSGNTSEYTTISDAGVLNVALDEEAESLTIRATSKIDGSIYGEKTVNVLEELVVNSISVRPSELTVVNGASVWFFETVTGTAPHTVTWSVSGSTNENTYITSEGNLKVAADETANTLTVTATSSYDDTKASSATITVNHTRTFINKIEFSYDTKEAYLTTKTTYNEVRTKFRNNWSVKAGANYSSGNNNIYFKYCPTKAKCSLDETKGGYEETILDRYTYVDFEIYANPFGNESENPVYDFDEDNLDKIEVWVNGVKRSDAIITYYNDSWRSVDVFIPVSVVNEKITQSMHFYHEEYETYYEVDSFKNTLYHTTGDGEVTYSSSNPSVASIDPSTGLVTVHDIGEAIIYATAAETEDYQARTVSYRLIVARKEIYPTLTIEDQTYTGSELKPEVTVKYNEKTLIEGTDYELIYSNNLNVGNASVTAKSLDSSKYVFERATTFYINKKVLTEENIIAPSIIAYEDGSPLTPSVIVKDGERILIKDTDYMVSYSNQTAGVNGHVAINITGQGNYSGYLTKEVLVQDSASIVLETPVLKIAKGVNNSLILNIENNEISATYEIYRSTNKTKGFVKIAEVKESIYTNISLTYGTTYYYKVIAKNGDNKTNYSNLVSMKVAPDKIEDLSILSVSTNQVKLGWTKNETVTGYELYRATKLNGKYTKVATTKNVDNYLNNRLAANTNYYYKIRAYKTVGRTKVYGAYSDTISVKTAPVAPKISLTVADYDAINIKVSSVKGAVKHEIYRSLAKNGTYEKIAEISTANYKDSFLTSGVTYYYKVRSCSQVACGNYSSIASKAPVAKTPTISLKVNENKRVLVKISDVNGADGYEIARSLYKNRKFSTVGSTEALEYIDEVGLNTRYYYKVRAYTLVDGKKVYGAYSQVKYASVSLSAPTFTLTKKSLDQANININAVSGASGYEISRSTNKYRGFKVIGTTDKLENVDTLTLNTTYYYKVRAFITSNGKKYYSKYSSVKAGKLVLGTPVVNMTQTGLDKVTVTIEPVADAESYEIYRSTNKTKGFKLISATDELSYEDTINLNTTYYYKVRAVVTINEKKYYSGYTSLKTVRLGVGTPTFALTGQEQQVEVTINEVTYAEGYEIYRATSKYGKFTKVGETDALTYNDPAQSNKTYYYKVRAFVTINEKRVYGGFSALKSVKAK